MRIVCALVKYFPFGGLQKDMLAISRELQRRGHQVEVVTSHWEGERPADLTVTELPLKRAANHRINARFAKALAEHLRAQPADCVVGFNKLPGLDIYYAADTCFRDKVMQERSWLHRWLPRYRRMMEQEAAVFGPQQQTQILMISEREIDCYRRHYGTALDRFHLLPPGISRDRCVPSDYPVRRAALRQQFGFAADERIVLMVGSGFRTKGLDRAIQALANLPRAQRLKARLLVIGKDNPERFIRQARALEVEDRVEFLGGRDNIPEYLWAADLLIHPAYRENTGTVLLEAGIAGLPVLTTDVCGYAPYVSDFGFGRVLHSPIQQRAIDSALADMLVVDRRRWREAGIDFGRREDIYSMPVHAAAWIERLGTTHGRTVSG